MGRQQDEQVALNGTKENENKQCTQNQGGHSDARATVCNHTVFPNKNKT